MSRLLTCFNRRYSAGCPLSYSACEILPKKRASALPHRLSITLLIQPCSLYEVRVEATKPPWVDVLRTGTVFIGVCCVYSWQRKQVPWFRLHLQTYKPVLLLTWQSVLHYCVFHTMDGTNPNPNPNTTWKCGEPELYFPHPPEDIQKKNTNPNPYEMPVGVPPSDVTGVKWLKNTYL